MIGPKINFMTIENGTPNVLSMLDLLKSLSIHCNVYFFCFSLEDGVNVLAYCCLLVGSFDLFAIPNPMLSTLACITSKGQVIVVYCHILWWKNIFLRVYNTRVMHVSHPLLILRLIQYLGSLAHSLDVSMPIYNIT